MTPHQQHPRTGAASTFCALLTICLLTTFINAGAQSTSAPALRFFVGDTMIETGKGVAEKDVPNLKIKVVSGNTSDVYKITSWYLWLRRSTDLGSPIQGSGEDLNLSFVAKGAAGAVIAVEVHNMTRTDANGKKEKVNLTTGLKYASIPINK